MTTERGLAAFALVAALAITLLAPASAQQSSPLSPPPGSQVTTISAHAGFFDEPAIAIDPKNPNQLVAAFQSPARVSYSRDAGAHWQLTGAAWPPNYAVSGDVSITYDTRGHAILCYIAFDKLGASEYWAHNATRNGIFVRRSLDGGKTWENRSISIDEQPTRPVMPFEDKPYIVADNNLSSPYTGNLYVGWTEFSLTKSVILFSRSTDGGLTWSDPIEISTHEGIPRDDNGAVEGFSAAAAPDGVLYAIWSDGGSIVLAVSRDGGVTFSPSHVILETPASYFKVGDVERSDGFPQIGIDPRAHRLFVTWTDYRNGDVDVFCSTSSDRGQTWSAPVRVNNDPLHDGADQFFQWLAVDPSDGSANVVFYDRRGDPANKSSIIVLARSTDGGHTFANYAWTTTPFDAEDKFMGDYTGIAALNGRVYAAWTYGPPLEASTAAAQPQRARRAPRVPAIRPSTIVQVGSANFHPSPH